MISFNQLRRWWFYRKKPQYSKNFLQAFGTLMLVTGFIFGSYQAVNHFLLPRIFALDDTTHTWDFDNASEPNYTYDSDLISITDSGATINSGNQFSNPSFVTNNDGWSVAAVEPNGWVEVPGDVTYSTSNFLVMQYEAKYNCTGDSNGDDVNACEAAGKCTSGSCDADSGLGLDYRDIVSFNKENVVSSANGAPLVHITQTQALTACPTGYHLITDNEWMTIARNAEAQTANWVNGEIGGLVSNSRGFKRGNVGALDSVGYNGADPEYGVGRDEKAMFTLSNGSQVWDMSGNVYDWTAGTIMGANKPVGNPSAWVEWTTVSNYGSLTYNDVRPSNDTWDANHGMGRYYQGSASGGPYAFLRGGNWNDTAYAGVFAFYLGVTPAFQYYNIGFRCASDSVDIFQSYQSNSGRSDGANQISVGSIADAKIFQSINVGVADAFKISVFVRDTNPDGGVISESIAQLYYNGEEVTTSYDDADADGWYELTASVTGASEEREFGLVVRKSETVLVDDFTVARDSTYSIYSDTYSNAQVESWDSLTETGSASNNASIGYQFCPNDAATCETDNTWQWWNSTTSTWEVASNQTTDVNTQAQLTTQVIQALDTANQKLAVKVIFGFGGVDEPILNSLQLGLTTDTIPPDVQATNARFKRTSGASESYAYDSENIPWTNNLAPFFGWTAGSDVGSGIAGYCLYLGQDLEASYNASGVSGENPNGTYLSSTSPVSTAGTDCRFIIGTNQVDFATTAYRSSTWLESSNNPYYLKIWAVDNGGNVQANTPAFVAFKYDGTRPTNVGYISPASGSFSNVVDMNFSWPTSSSGAATDSNSQVLGWQYQINSTSGTWLGTETHLVYGFSYIPVGNSTYALTIEQDEDSISSGDNIVYFRTIDSAGNFSTDATIRTGKLAYGGAAPQFGDTDSVSVTPSSTDTNSFALSWPEAEATAEQVVAGYYYMVNTSPPSAYSTLIGNQATYIPNGTSTAVSAKALPNVNKGSNSVYVVAVDDADNYSPSNYISGTFTLNSNDPDNAGNLVASDSSIKAQSQWNVTLTWTAPGYQGAGNLTYKIYRSENGESFLQVGSTSGLSYVDTTPESKQYYYKIYTQDGAEATSSGTNAVTITPTGKWTSPPTLTADPEVSNITTKRAKISWSTNRNSDSKIAFGTASGKYYDEEPSNSDQVTSHVINLTNLSPGTKYYYQAKWTDEDGNTSTSEEKHFSTDLAPTVQDVIAKNIGLSSAILEFTSKGASKVKIYYGTTTDFGSLKEVLVATGESSYTSEVSDLLDGTKYYYKINTVDSEGDEYEGTILDFTTLPRPRISNVRIQQVKNSAQPTVLVTWTSNTNISSIITYWPTNDSSSARDEVDVTLKDGSHEIIVRSLYADTAYTMQVKGRDKIGNEAVSDLLSFTTATDTRPPLISNINIEGATIPQNRTAGQESTAQLVVSWNTDEPATSQVEFGEGSGSNYAQTTQLDNKLTYNHLVVISNLTPSKVYHLRVISKDKAGNESKSVDNVVITPKATDNALDLVITNLAEIFGIFGNIK